MWGRPRSETMKFNAIQACIWVMDVCAESTQCRILHYYIKDTIVVHMLKGRGKEMPFGFKKSTLMNSSTLYLLTLS